MFKRFKKDKGLHILSPMDGEVFSITEVDDPTFSDKLLGDGIAIRPRGSRVVAPFEGTVSQMFDTGHAVTLTSKDGIELLIHVGLDTVSLKGQHYTVHVADGDTVRPGDLLMEFDREAISAAGYDTITPVVICNSGDFGPIQVDGSGSISEQEPLLTLSKA